MGTRKTRGHFDSRDTMGKGIDWLLDFIHNPDRSARAAGAAAGAAVPGAAVAAVGSAYGLAGGAAIMKTLALAGAAVGGSATAGIWVVGVGAVGVGCAVAEGVSRLRSTEDEADQLYDGGWLSYSDIP